ncbi:MAG TPA: hypothetical protein VNZ43_00960 [Sphingomonadaceae bacterium]|nr:hypothetical protein [Sphingomonadaceae bacterium]
MGALALTIAATPAAAQMTPKASAASQREIGTLRAEIESLRARLDAQDAAQRETRAQAEAAAQQAQAAQAQVQQIPDQVQTAMARAPKDKPKWFDDTSISGRMYFNVSSVKREVNGQETEHDGGFLIKRFYLGVDHKFNDVFSGNITTDIDSVVGTNGSTIGKGLYVKKAYLQAKLDKALVIRLGAADLPWIPYAEGLYGYRHIENTLADRTKFGTSADWGVHVMGEFADGLVSYQVSAIDGAGYRDPKFTKTIDLEGRISVAYKGFNVGVGGYTGKLGKDQQDAITHHRANRLNALIAYKTKLFTVGGEYFSAKNWTQVTSVVEDKAEGYSVFGSVSPLPKWSIFGRYDWVKPRKDTVSDFKDHYYNVGIQYSPAKIVDLALVYKRDKADNGILSTSNGNIGGSIDGTYSEFGLFGQFRF